ncbi:MAG: redoxin domain-containing protein [Micromonosporaceae bacterium]|nr:redoxin domain-containing protein [Micromonosporaceae bacterium]
MTRPRPAIPALLLGLLVALAGCQGGGRPAEAGPDVTVSPLADCQGLTEPPAEAAPAVAGSGEPLPDLTLPCFTGGEPFRLADLRGPAVVNLWASWCAPCREELPALQRYADQMASRVQVLGVVTEDRPAAAAALATDLGVRFPALEDQPGRLQAEIGGMGLPVTLLVDAAGQLRYVHVTGALKQPELASLVAEHLGVPE